MIEASGQWLVASGLNFGNLATSINSENPENPLILANRGNDVLLNTERLKFIDEISRLILELKEQFPKLAQYLSKAMDNFSTNQENIPIKILTNLLTQIQQNLDKPAVAETETVKTLVDEVIKILQPSKEAPPEYKLVLALSKNDFASANIAVKNIVQAAVIPQQNQAPQQIQVPQQTQIPLQSQVPQQIQIPQQMQIPVPTQVPQQIQIPQQMQIPVPTQVPQQIQIPQQIQTPQQTQTPLQIQLPLQIQIPQATATTMQTFQTIFNALQELKEFGIPIELKNAPLKELETIVLQKTGIELDKNLPNLRDLQNFFYEKPTYATISLLPAKQTVHFENVATIVEIPLPKDFPVQKIFSNILQTPPPIIPQQPQQQPTPQPQQPVPQPQQPQFIPQQPQPQQSIPQQPQQQPIPQQPIPQQPIPQPPQQQQPVPQPQPQQQPIPQKIEMAFSLHQINIPQNITPQNNIPSQNTPPPTPKFILQPWPVSTLIPKEERDFWQKTDLPLTPQILNIRETILSFGKLPENPEVVKLFANNLHEMSLQTEHGTYVSKEQANLLWRVVQHSQLSTLNSQLLKYQPTGNFEGELFKNLPEPVRRELQRELPAGKTWQPEILQKAVEKVLEKYEKYEEPQLIKANPNEHTSKHSEEIKQVLQNLKEQIQWTRIDQDTRLQNDRENVFYFMHEGNLQKGRLKIKDERKGNSKKHQGSSISFSIETKTKNLGDVHADLTLSKSILNIRLQDSVGTAGETVQAERETLAKELADIGITLGELLYGKIPKVRNLPINKPEEKKNSGLDVRA